MTAAILLNVPNERWKGQSEGLVEKVLGTCQKKRKALSALGFCVSDFKTHTNTHTLIACQC